MTYLDIFTLRDVFIASTGLVIASLVRIYYDSYIEQRKIKRFTQSLTVYNCLVEEDKDGLLILSEDNEIIYANNEATHLLHTDERSLNTDYLDSIKAVYENDHSSLLEIIHSKTYISHADISLSNAQIITVSLSINKVHTDKCDWYIAVLRDMSSMCELRDRTIDLLGAA